MSDDTESVRSSLGLLHPDTLAEISDMSSSLTNSDFTPLSVTNDDDDDDDNVDDGDCNTPTTSIHDFEPTPIAYSNDLTPMNSGCLPSNLLGPSESTPNSPGGGNKAMPPAIQRLLQSLVAVAAQNNNTGDGDNSRLSWDKVFNDVSKELTASFCTGQFTARSTSFGGGSDSTRNERFSDYTQTNTTSGSGSISSNNITLQSEKDGNVDEPFESQQPDEFADEEFHELNSEFINEAERENKEKFRFIQEQTVSSDVTGISRLGFSNFSTNTNGSTVVTDSQDHLSRSQYFLLNTSRLGNSIFNSDENARPHLGFEAIRSPDLKARPLLPKGEPSDASSSSSSTTANSTFTLNEDDVSNASTISNVPKKLQFFNDSNLNEKSLEKVLKSKLSSDGQLDLNFISMLVKGDEDGGDDDKKKEMSTEYLLSVLLKTLETSAESKNDTADISCITGSLPSFLNVSTKSTESTKSSKSLQNPPKAKRSSVTKRHSSPIRPRTEQVKIQPINRVIKSSKSVDDEPNVSIVVVDQKKWSASSIQILTRDGDKIDFGTLPEDCSTTQDLMLVHNGESNHEINLEIQGQLPSFIYPTDGQTRHIQMISSKSMVLTLPKISKTEKESVACNIKISIHTPASGGEIRTLQSQINILCEGKLLAQVPMIARVGQVKLQTLKSNKLPTLTCSPNGSWVEHFIPMMNFGNIPMTLAATISNCPLGIFEPESPFTIFPQKEHKALVKFYAKDIGEAECTMKCTVQPNGTSYEVPIKVISKFLSKEGSSTAEKLKLPVIQFGKLPDTEANHSIDKPVNPSKKSSIGNGKAFTFPVEADKSFLTWLAVGHGSTEERILILRNAFNETLSVNLSIRDCEYFKLKIGDGDGSKTKNSVIEMGPSATQTVRVSFHPPAQVSHPWYNGKLILKPQSLKQSGKAYKATIALQGNVGSPELILSGFGDEINGKQSLFLGQLSKTDVITKVLSVYNRGSGPAFVRCAAYADADCRLPADLSGVIRLENGDAFVVLPNETVSIPVKVDPSKISMSGKNHVFVGTVNVYHGSEVRRMAMRRALKTISSKDIRDSPFAGVEFDSSFIREDSVIPFRGLLAGVNDIKQFYKTTKRVCVELTGVSGSHEETIVKFSALPVEETLCETLTTFSHSPPTRCPPISEEERRPPNVFRIECDFAENGTDIVLESGKTTSIKITNTTTEDQRFDLGWPAHILMIQPSNGVVQPEKSETLVITAMASDRRKTTIAIYSSHGDTQHVGVQVIPARLSLEPNKIKFAHPGTEMKVYLKNGTENRIQWHTDDSDSNFVLSTTSGTLNPRQSVEFTLIYKPVSSKGGLINKSFQFHGRSEVDSFTALLEVSGGQHNQSLLPVPSVKPFSEHREVVDPTTKKTVYLDQECISFPDTRVGEYSTVKVIVKNRLNTAQVFNVEALTTPFSTKYHEAPIVIKPMSYLGFPVTFTPMAKGNYKQNIVLKNNHKMLVGTLLGICK